tara:strand:+ start:30130 stop:30450 length:321 start_codon:yes stop_codon:yes gene_type:complete
MTYNNTTLEDAQREADYIKAIDPCFPPIEYCYKPAVFARYCRMQIDHMVACNFSRLVYGDIEQAEYIALHAADYRARRAPKHQQNIDLSNGIIQITPGQGKTTSKG